MKHDFISTFIKIGLIVLVILLTLCAIAGATLLFLYLLSCVRGVF